MSILLTGATGFLGEQLLPLLAKRHKKIFLLVRDTERAEKYFEHAPFKKQLHLLRGDLYQPGLGITDTEWEDYQNEFTGIWHCAANLSFNPKDREEVMTCNFHGTTEVLRKALHCSRLKRFYYVSTAFVHGNSQAVMKEDILLPANSFSFLNYYEESKYLAEERIRASGIPFTIFRPAIIMGHSTTGKASSMVTYFGFYNALNKAFKNGRHFPQQEDPLRVEGINGRRNHICVDHAAAMMNEIAQSETSAYKTYHLAYGKQGRVQDIFNAINRCLRSNFVIEETVERNTLNLTETLARRLSSDYRPYIMRHDPILDRSNTLSLVSRDPSLAIPLEEYLYKMYRVYADIQKEA